MEKIIFDKPISTYWWNMGTKKNDFNGTISDFFKEKGITVKTIVSPNNNDATGFKFKLPVGSTVITFTHYGWKNDAGLLAVKFFLTALGDKAQIKMGGRVVNLNN